MTTLGSIRVSLAALAAVAVLAGMGAPAARAQVPPSPSEIKGYESLHAAAAAGDLGELRRLIGAGAPLDMRDRHGRTPLMVAAYKRDLAAAGLLIDAGADLNALDRQDYDVLTISGVLDDPAMVRLALKRGADPALVTSPYRGTALIASAHLGHVEVVRLLVEAGAPLDHVNNLDWTALIEAIVLGDGGPAHTEIVGILVAAGADVNLADGGGNTPLALAQRRGYRDIAQILEAAGAR